MPLGVGGRCPQGHEFIKDNTYVDKFQRRHCKACRRERMRALRAEAPGPGQGAHNREKTHCPHGHEYTPENTYLRDGKRSCRSCARRNRIKQNVQRYGITVEQYDEMLQGQGGCCAICREPFGDRVRVNVDHDHRCCSAGGSCGKCVRGLLCTPCNQGLGRFKDSPHLLRYALTYLGY